MTAASPMKKAALAYAKRGYPVFPVRGKWPAIKMCEIAEREDLRGDALKQHVDGCPLDGHGFYDATTDATRITEWWTRYPNAGVAMSTGFSSGVFVLDVDAEHGGDETLSDLCASYSALPETPVVLTGGGGSHYWFKMPEEEFRNTTGALGPGLDTRGEGGYVVVPRSPHKSGKQYEWDSDAHIDDVPLAEAPEWLLGLLRLKKASPTPAPRSGDTETFSEGTRNTSLFRLGASLRGHGMDGDVIEAALLAANQAHCDPPLPDSEVMNIAGSVTRYAPGPSAPELRVGEASAPEPGSPEAAEALSNDVARELHSLRVRDEARRLFQKEQRANPDPPTLESLSERLARPRVETQFLIPGWQPRGSRVVLAAQYKAGKTTLTGNLVRSLVDGTPFLDAVELEPVGMVVVLDTEMSPATLDLWLEDQRIEHPERVLVASLRGNVAAFNILDVRVRAEWVERLRGADYLVLDNMRPVLDALGLDEHRDAGQFFVAFDALLAEAGIPDALVVHHMGHVGERARGDSRIRDWPDVEWRLVRQDEEPQSPRFISAYGRDVEVPETQLVFDPETRHLSVGGGSRKDAKVSAALNAVVAVLTASDAPMSKRAIERALSETDFGRIAVREAVTLGCLQGRIQELDRKGRGGGSEYIIPVEISLVRQVRRSAPAQFGSAPPLLDSGALPAQVLGGSAPVAQNEESEPRCSWCGQPAGAPGLNKRGLCEDCTLGGGR